ncbi:hypothetical protein B0O80DRAFT_503279 [Mortierella sp. GBAus27b]|nr:hypothetical protein BGX31_009887 [Mortierella sp. GBA43]KAI8346633.1 hypothetical protein B0O80DRAFT_503279 [Mortierella sp. GBAus27b]
MASTTTSSASSNTLPDPLVLRLLTKDDQEEVATLFCETFKREPLGEYCGVNPSEGVGLASAAVQDPVSFVVEDTSLEGPHKLVAFRTSCMITAQSIAEKQKKTQEEGPEDAIQAILGHMMDLWAAKTTVFTSNPEARVMKFMALGVDTRYEGRGLAKALLNAAMDKAMETKCDAVVVIASAFATQHLFKNRLGFEEIAKIRYTDFSFVDKRKGSAVEEKPFPNLVQPEFLIILEKKLEVAA